MSWRHELVPALGTGLQPWSLTDQLGTERPPTLGHPKPSSAERSSVFLAPVEARRSGARAPGGMNHHHRRPGKLISAKERTRPPAN